MDMLKPGTSTLTRIKTTLSYLIFTVFLLFSLYTLVYVQCDERKTRPCPLPFNPHAHIRTAQTFVRLGVRTGNEWMRPGMDAAKVIGRDAVVQVNDLYHLFIVPEWTRLVEPVVTYMYTYDVVEKTDAYVGGKMREYRVVESVGLVVELVAEQVWNDGVGVYTRVMRDAPVVAEATRTITHRLAVYFVDIFIPTTVFETRKIVNVMTIHTRRFIEIVKVQVKAGIENVKIGGGEVARWVHEWDSVEFVKHVRTHPILVQTWLLYHVHVKEYVDIVEEWMRQTAMSLYGAWEVAMVYVQTDGLEMVNAAVEAVSDAVREVVVKVKEFIQ